MPTGTTLTRKKRSVDEISIDMLKRMIEAEEQEIDMKATSINDAVGVHHALGKPILDNMEKRGLVTKDSKKFYKTTTRGKVFLEMRTNIDDAISILIIAKEIVHGITSEGHIHDKAMELQDILIKNEADRWD